MTEAASRTSRLTLAVLTGVLAVLDGVLAAIGLLVWDAYRSEDLTSTEAATFVVLGASAAAGAVLMLLAMVALALGARGHGIARLAAGCAWLRLTCVVIALAAVAVRYGTAAIVGSFETFGAVVAVVDTIFGLIVAGVAVRRTRH